MLIGKGHRLVGQQTRPLVRKWLLAPFYPVDVYYIKLTMYYVASVTTVSLILECFKGYQCRQVNTVVINGTISYCN